MSNMFCTNRFGSVPVWDDLPGDNGSMSGVNQIGTLADDESFAYIPDWGGDGVFNRIYFRNSSGKLVYGFVYNRDKNGNKITRDDLWNSVCCPFTHNPYRVATINGKTYPTFKARRQEEIYTAAKTLWGHVAAGMEVACADDTAGDTRPDWKKIIAVKRSTDNKWITVSGDGYNYGFVDTGMASYGSTASTISIYGNWG